MHPGGVLRAVAEDLEPAVLMTQGVDVGHDALRTEAQRGLGDEFGLQNGLGVDDAFVGASCKACTDILQRPDASPHGEGHHADLPGGLDKSERIGAGVLEVQVVAPHVVVIFSGDVDEHQFIDIPIREALDGAHRIADVLMHGKLLATDEQSVFQENCRDKPWIWHWSFSPCDGFGKGVEQ